MMDQKVYTYKDALEEAIKFANINYFRWKLGMREFSQYAPLAGAIALTMYLYHRIKEMSAPEMYNKKIKEQGDEKHSIFIGDEPGNDVIDEYNQMLIDNCAPGIVETLRDSLIFNTHMRIPCQYADDCSKRPIRFAFNKFHVMPESGYNNEYFKQSVFNNLTYEHIADNSIAYNFIDMAEKNVAFLYNEYYKHGDEPWFAFVVPYLDNSSRGTFKFKSIYYLMMSMISKDLKSYYFVSNSVSASFFLVIKNADKNIISQKIFKSSYISFNKTTFNKYIKISFMQHDHKGLATNLSEHGVSHTNLMQMPLNVLQSVFVIINNQDMSWATIHDKNNIKHYNQIIELLSLYGYFVLESAQINVSETDLDRLNLIEKHSLSDQSIEYILRNYCHASRENYVKEIIAESVKYGVSYTDIILSGNKDTFVYFDKNINDEDKNIIMELSTGALQYFNRVASPIQSITKNMFTDMRDRHSLSLKSVRTGPIIHEDATVINNKWVDDELLYHMTFPDSSLLKDDRKYDEYLRLVNNVFGMGVLCINQYGYKYIHKIKKINEYSLYSVMVDADIVEYAYELLTHSSINIVKIDKDFVTKLYKQADNMFTYISDKQIEELSNIVARETEDFKLTRDRRLKLRISFLDNQKKSLERASAN